MVRPLGELLGRYRAVATVYTLHLLQWTLVISLVREANEAIAARHAVAPVFHKCVYLALLRGIWPLEPGGGKRWSRTMAFSSVAIYHLLLLSNSYIRIPLLVSRDCDAVIECIFGLCWAQEDSISRARAFLMMNLGWGMVLLNRRPRMLFKHQSTMVVDFLSGTGSRLMLFSFLRGVQLVKYLH